MAENSKIEWTHHTANLWWGCTEVHEGCDNCYARVLDNRWGEKGTHWGNDKPRRAIKSVWSDLVKYQNKAAETGEMHRVFVGSMMDIFEKDMPCVDSKGNPAPDNISTNDYRQLLFHYISIGKYPNLLFLFLTKRPSNINKYIPDIWKTNPPANVMFGCSVVNQQTANTLIPQLLDVNGKRFLSIEPQLDSVDLEKWISPCGYYCAHSDEDFSNAVNAWCEEDIDEDEQVLRSSFFYHDHHKPDKSKIDWVICGGESGAKKRPFNPDWARLLYVQCTVAGVPFFMKQWDKVQPIPSDLMIREFPESTQFKNSMTAGKTAN